MKIRIIAVGKIKRGPLTELIDEYEKRMRWTVQITEIDHGTKSSECAQLLSHLTPDDFVVVMDERGESLASQDFSQFIEKIQLSGKPRLTFVIGGAEGYAQDFYAHAHKKLAFGIQTWPHMFVRVMLVEQLYRAEQILAGHPYHKQ